MNKFLVLIIVLFGFQVCASSAGEMKEKERCFSVGFLGTDGNKYSLRAATIEDIDDARLGLGDVVKADRKDRIAKGYFGVFVIENEAGQYAGKLFTGRMPLGVQPWPCEKDSADEKRLGIILGFYDWLLSLHKIDSDHTNVVRSSAPDLRVELVNNKVHAATAVLSTDAPFNTVAIQDALAVLTGKLGFGVAPDADITPAGKPLLIISIGASAPPVLSKGSPSRVFAMPYYEGKEGMRFTTVTSMEGLPIPELPGGIAADLEGYLSSL